MYCTDMSPARCVQRWRTCWIVCASLPDLCPVPCLFAPCPYRPSLSPSLAPGAAVPGLGHVRGSGRARGSGHVRGRGLCHVTVNVLTAVTGDLLRLIPRVCKTNNSS